MRRPPKAAPSIKRVVRELDPDMRWPAMRSLERALETIPDLQIRDQALKELLQMEAVLHLVSLRVRALGSMIILDDRFDPVTQEHYKRLLTRLFTMAALMEIPKDVLGPFLDLVGEEELTEARIRDAQYVSGLPTPVLSHLQFPGMEPPSFGRELLAAWLKRGNHLPHDEDWMSGLAIKEVIVPSPEDQVAFAQAILDPPPMAPALERAMKRRAEWKQCQKATENKETQALLKLLALGNQDVAEGRVEPVQDVIQNLRSEKPNPSRLRRVTTMAALLECPPDLLAGFLDFIAEEELTDGRITAAQFILGLPTPVLSHVNTPALKGDSAYGAARELLVQWRERAEPAGVRPEGCLCAWLSGQELRGWVVTGCPLHGPESELRTMTECLEEIQRAARHYLQNPADMCQRDRLALAEADARAVLYDLPRPRRSLAVEETDHVGAGTDMIETPEEATDEQHPVPNTETRDAMEEAEAIVRKLEELGVVAVRAAQIEKGDGTLDDLWEKADAGPRTDGVMRLEDMEEAKCRRGKPKKQEGPEGADIKAGIRAHMRKKHGKGKP